MKTAYVLTETDGGVSVLGVFDSPRISDDVLAGYFGPFETLETNDIRDSGIEWQKTIRWDDRVIVLTMSSYVVGEI